MMFMRAMRAYDIDDVQRITLTARGRYYLLAMMREFFIGVNGVRDQARSDLPEDERQLIFGDGTAACDVEHPVATAVAETEQTEGAPVP